MDKVKLKVLEVQKELEQITKDIKTNGKVVFDWGKPYLISKRSEEAYRVLRELYNFMEEILETRPDFVTDEHLTYLDELRESGVTNMFGATPFLQNEFALSEKYAKEVLSYWMMSFGEKDR